MAVNNDDAIKQIFSRCLLNCLNIPLWYIFYPHPHVRCFNCFFLIRDESFMHIIMAFIEVFRYS